MARAGLRRQPEVELRKLTEDYCEFVLKKTDVSMANALRRIILVEVRRMRQPPQITGRHKNSHPQA
jgi:DNA-directed RNA polymerase subunit L